jgi:predicted N-acyltransferase
MSTIDAAAWDGLVGAGTPFLEHAWLRSLEEARCAIPEEGWLAQLLTAHDGEKMVGALPLYVKGNSFGEFVYDWSWADLAARMGVAYYPKMIVASPFSPVSGERILTSDDLSDDARERTARSLIRAALAIADGNGVSGLHFLFVPPWQAKLLEEEGFFLRHSLQYHWKNRDYGTFDDFLAGFSSKRRAAIRRERREVAKSGIVLESKRGDELDSATVDKIFEFYTSTTDKFVWGRRYLNRELFGQVVETMPDRVRAILARDGDGDLVAGTFNMVKGDRFYGRYWGATRDVRFLHFEACYYYPIEMAIAEGLEHIEPGAGGEHKYVRGYEPTRTTSAHWIGNPRLASVLTDYCLREGKAVDDEIESMLECSPIRS